MRRRSPPRSPEEEKERERRRREWRILQEKEREHERLKRQKIEEYERKRQELLKEEATKRRDHGHRSRSYSRSRSASEERARRNHSRAISSNAAQVVSQKLNSWEGNRPFFKGPEKTKKYREEELKEITVQIKRPMPAPTTDSSDIRRDIVKPEDIMLRRRPGEGEKPIFDREELKFTESGSIDVEERTIISASKTSPDKKSQQPKKRSVSLSPRRHRSPDPQHRSCEHSHRSRRDEHSRHRSEDRHKDKRRSSRESSRRRRERSYSTERTRRSEREYSRSSRNEKDYRDYRGRSKSYDRYDRMPDSSRERHLSSAAYVEPMPYLYYGRYAPRPMFVGPPMRPPIRAPMVGGPFPPIPPMGPHYRPRLMGPQHMYRPVLPPDPRFG